MPRRKSRIHLSGERDLLLMTFLWKWKVATSAVLMKRFFGSIAPATAYRRLWTLEKGGFIESIANGHGTKFVWTLIKRGYSVAKSQIPCTLKEDGFRSEHVGHDLLVAAFQLGDWAFGSPPGVKSFSEQQLRRYHPEDYPAFVPKDEFHRPDGYIHVGNGVHGRTFAIEVEITPKRKRAYLGIGEFYRDVRLDGVIWLVPRLSIAKTMGSNLKDPYRPNAPDINGMVLFDDFRTLGWGSKIVCGHGEGNTVGEVICGNGYKCPTSASNPVVTSWSLNVAKTPHKSKTCKTYEIGDFSV